MDIQVSVIVPVYNVQKYINRCLDSLVHQSLEALEIIVVNDGSPDESQKIIDRYVQEYPERVRSYQKENGGLSSARNFGIPLANGKYIGFVDSDDYVETDMYQKMWESAEENKSDLVLCDLVYEWENHQREPMEMRGVHKFEGAELRQSLFLSPLFSWNKLYRKEFFIQNQFQFPEKLWYEDIPVIVPMFAMAEHISYVDEIFVHYLQRENSIMSSAYSSKMADIFTQLESIYETFEKKGFLKQYRDEIEYLYIEHLMLYGAFRFLRTDHSKELMKTARELIKKRFPDWKTNRYIQTFTQKNRLFLKYSAAWNDRLFKAYIERRDQL